MKKRMYGYVRVSSKDQNEHRQLFELINFGIPKKDIYIDKLSGKDFNRPAYRNLVYDILKPGDLLVIKSIDRLGRNYHEVLEEWRTITKEIRADIKILDMPLLDTHQHNDLIGTLISDIVLQLLSFVAENERNNIRQRQAEGIAAAKRRGVKFGRPPITVDANFAVVYKKWKTGEITRFQAMEQTHLPYSTFYKVVKRYEENRTGIKAHAT